MTDDEPKNPNPDDPGTEPLKALEVIGDTKVAPTMGVAAMALSMALKYHDINTIQDGALYQQYRLEGRNINTLHLDMVFDTAIRMERHLALGSERVAQLLAEALFDVIEEVDKKSDEELQKEIEEETARRKGDENNGPSTA